MFSFFFCQEVIAQVYTLKLKPGNSGEDAFIASYNSSLNFGSHPEFGADAWTCGGINCFARSLIRFDLSAIPSGAVILDAKLSLFANTNPVNGNGVAMQGQNEANLYAITSAWNESSVTWNNQPSYSSIVSVPLPQSTSSAQDYLNLNVTNIIQNMYVNPLSNFGFMLKLTNEIPFTTMTFASGDYSDSLLWPELNVQFSLPSLSDTCIVLSAGDPQSSDAFLASSTPNSNYGWHPEFAAQSWTCQSAACFTRGLLNFDFTMIPQGAVINSAVLNLFANPTPLNGNGIAMQGNNTSVLQRVVSPWTENGVAWSTQPNTSNVNEVILSQSNNSFQDYLGINVTNLVKDMFISSSGSYGFLLRLLNEAGYTTMTFASGDFSQSSLHPTLEICFDFPTGLVQSKNSERELVRVYPNPSDGNSFNVELLRGSGENMQISLYDIQGRMQGCWKFNSLYKPGENLDLTLSNRMLRSGIYLLEFRDDLLGSSIQKIVIEN